MFGTLHSLCSDTKRQYVRSLGDRRQNRKPRLPVALVGCHLCRRTLPLYGAALGLKLVTVRREMSRERQVIEAISTIQMFKNSTSLKFQRISSGSYLV